MASGSAVSNDDAAAATEGAEPVELVDVPGTSFAEIPVDAIVPTGVSHGLILIRQKLPSCQLQLKKLVCYSRSWCAPGLKVSHCLMVFHVKRCPADAPMSWLWVSGVCAPRVRLAWKPFPQLCVQPQMMMICCVMPLLENLHRVQLNPLEEAAAYQQLLDDFGCTQSELAERIARSRSPDC